MGRESKIEKYVQEELDKLGIEIRKAKWVNRKGAPDRLIFVNGGIWVEFKADPKAPISIHQKRELKLMRNAGMTAGIVATMQDAFELIQAIKVMTDERV